MLSYLKRWSTDFSDVRVLVLLFNSLVRFLLEYNTLIWSPFFSSHIKRFEAVQNNFLKYLMYTLGLGL